MGGSFARHVVTGVAIATLILLLALAAVVGGDLLLLLFASVLLAILLRGISDALSRRTRLSPRWSFLVTVAGILGAGALATFLLAPTLVEELAELRERLPKAIESIRRALEELEWGRRLLHAIGNIESGAKMMERAATAITLSARYAGYTLFVVVTGLYLAATPALYVRGLLSLFAPARRERAREVLEAVGRQLWGFLVGRVASMLAVGVFTWLGLWLLNVPLSALLAVIAGTLTFVPYLGPIAGGVPIGIIAVMESVELLVYAVVYYTILQSVEGFLITPLVQQHFVRLAPALTLAVQIFMGLVAGLLGVVLSVPLAAALLVVVRKVYIEGILGDRTDGPGRRPRSRASR